MHPRVQQIETARTYLHRNAWSEYHTVAHTFSRVPITPLDALVLLDVELRPRLTFRPSQTDFNRGSRHELLRSPLRLLRNGGDCDATNIGLAGGLLRYWFGSGADLGSLYWPNIVQPRHATLGLRTTEGTWSLDLTPDHRQRGNHEGLALVMPGTGHFIPWND